MKHRSQTIGRAVPHGRVPTRTTLKVAVLAALALLASIAHPLARAADPDPNKSPALCGAADTPEAGIQGDVNAATVNCGLTLLSEIPFGGSVQGSGHCAYVRLPGDLPYTGSVIKAYSLADPLNPVQTDEEPAVGGSESMRAMTVDGRAILVSGRAVYDISNCEDMVKKGEIAWPSANATAGVYVAATNSHEIAISHDAKRVYTGLGFAVADISDLEHPETWTVKNWTCEMNAQSGYPLGILPTACDVAPQGDYPRQYSHSSDDNLEGTVWYGANQNGDSLPGTGQPGTNLELPTARMVDISDPSQIAILDTLNEFPGHSMNWWRTADGREFIIGANESLSGPADTCQEYPRPTSLGNNLEAYVVEVTGKAFNKEKFESYRSYPLVTMAINRPENCEAATASGASAVITEYSLYNKNGAAFLMMEFGGAGLRVFDLRDGDQPKEAAYYNDGKGHVHSGVFHYDEARGIMVASGSEAMHVLVLQPQVIDALGLPYPTDPAYPYTKSGPGTGSGASNGGGSLPVGTGFILLVVALVGRRLGVRVQAKRHPHP
ncbi:MAG: hypothetical protein WC809_01000 [Sinimarinibacterium sp.]|jgi:hypothetical protein